jgi:PAS domain S-box-containing protein
MKEALKILFVEDVQSDAELIWHEISRNKILFERRLVESKKDYVEAIQDFQPDLIISDFSLPQFDGKSALTLKNELAPYIPFILVTGSINEEIAVEIMKAGADDYLIKQNLSRLGSAIKSALYKKEVELGKNIAEQMLRESEERFRMLFDKAPVGYQSLDYDGSIIEVNTAWLEILGYTHDEVVGKWFGNLLEPGYVENFRKRFPQFKAQGKIHSEFEMKRKDGSSIIAAFDGRIGHTAAGNFKQTHCVLQDITDLKKAESALNQKVMELERINDLTVDREMKMIELKREVNKLLIESGKKEKYKIVE